MGILSPITKKIKNAFINIIIRLNLPIDRNKIVISVFQDEFTCNAKYITKKLIERNLKITIIWVLDKKTKIDNFPERVKIVRKKTLRFYLEVMTSKIWIDNAINFFYFKPSIPKRKGQFLINTWHGSLGLKKIGRDDNKNPIWVKNAERCDTDTDFLISNSVFESEVYKNTYWPSVKILNYGHPRNDILFISENESNKIKEIFCKKIKTSSSTRFVLWGPTFRDVFSNDIYNINHQSILDSLKLRFGGEWCFLVRLHHKLRKKLKFSDCNNIIDVTDYPDIQELLVISDVGITDYSSWICDFVLTSKPAFIYAPDIEDYNKERGFYYPLESTPFPVSSTQTQLLRDIENFNSEIYQKKQEQFLKARGCWEDGKASDRVVDKILSLIRKD